MYLIFDTETAGAPPSRKLRESASLKDMDIWPRLLQLGFIVYDKYRNPIQVYDQIIKPNGQFTVEEGAMGVHGISTEIAEEKGIPIEDAIGAFYDAINKCKYIICHNLDFDYNIMIAEHFRNKIKERPDTNERTKICTMLNTINYCELQPKYKSQKEFKWPKLEELHKKLFGYKFEGAHDALIDVKATAQCFWELIDRNIIFLNDDNVLRKEFVQTEPDSDTKTYDDSALK